MFHLPVPTRFSVCALSLVSAMCGSSLAVTEYARLSPNQFEVILEPLYTAILPFEAVRVRIMGRNVSSKQLGPVFSIDGHINILGFKPVAAEKYQNARRTYFDANPQNYLSSGGSHRGWKNTEQKIFLDPQEKRSVSIATGANWADKDGRWLLEDATEPFFPEEGDYLLKYGWIPGSSSADDYVPFTKEATIRIKVSAPAGQDKVVYDLLKKNRRLAAALLDTLFEPHPLVIAGIKDIVQQYPNTTYAKYARFALARLYLKGIGQRIGWKQSTSAESCLRFVSSLQGSKEEQFIRLVQLYFTPESESVSGRRSWFRDTLGRGYQTNYMSAAQRADINALLESRTKPKVEFEATIQQFVSKYSIVRPEDRAAGIAELEKLRNEKFAYQPDVLILLRKLYKEEQPEKAKDIEAILNRDFPDAIEWLEAVASSLTAEQWQTFRKTHIIPPPARVEDE